MFYLAGCKFVFYAADLTEDTVSVYRPINGNQGITFCLKNRNISFVFFSDNPVEYGKSMPGFEKYQITDMQRGGGRFFMVRNSLPLRKGAILLPVALTRRLRSLPRISSNSPTASIAESSDIRVSSLNAEL